MIIGDKQELRRCVKQAVRRAQITETLLDFDVAAGQMGVQKLMDANSLPSHATPFAPDAAAAYAALEALELPSRDIESAISMEQSYDRNAYLREVLDRMRARRVLVGVSLEKAHEVLFEDDRFSPLLSVSRTCFVPERYGVPYAHIADQIAAGVLTTGARDVLSPAFDEQAFRFCLLPACEDNRCVLHAHLDTKEQVVRFAQMLDEFSGVRALVSAEREAEALLIDIASARPRMLVRLSCMENLSYALERLGTRFMPYASCASLPEMMLGRWIGAREKLWPVLCEAYLPLARSGYQLTSQAIESDIEALLNGNLNAMYL